VFPRAGERTVVLLLVLATALPMVALAWARLRLQLPAGDEPHYLIISQALARYGSLDVQQVYDHRDYWSYYPLLIQPHVAPGPDGTSLPLHSIGGPVLWLVPFLLWGRAGAVGFMVVVSLLIVANVYWLVRALDVDRRVAVSVAFAFGVGTPVLTYAAMSFVEPIGALGCVYALRVLHQRDIRNRDLLLVSAALGVLPWVHGRFLLFPPLFLAFFVVRLRREPVRLVRVLAPAAVLFAGLELYDLLLWHTPALAPNQVSAGAVPLQDNPLPALLGTVLDQEVGVIPNFPVFLFVLPGLVLAASRRALNAHVALLVVPYTLVVCSFPAWDGAWSPPSRFMAVVLPLLAGHVAIAWQRIGGALLVGYAALLTGLAVGTANGGFSARSGVNPALARLDALTGVDLTRWVPSSALDGQQLLFLGWAVAVLAVAAVVVVRARATPTPPRPLPPPARPGAARSSRRPKGVPASSGPAAGRRG
jgi:hypothetical protein